MLRLDGGPVLEVRGERGHWSRERRWRRRRQRCGCWRRLRCWRRQRFWNLPWGQGAGLGHKPRRELVRSVRTPSHVHVIPSARTPDGRWCCGAEEAESEAGRKHRASAVRPVLLPPRCHLRRSEVSGKYSNSHVFANPRAASLTIRSSPAPTHAYVKCEANRRYPIKPRPRSASALVLLKPRRVAETASTSTTSVLVEPRRARTAAAGR